MLLKKKELDSYDVDLTKLAEVPQLEAAEVVSLKHANSDETHDALVQFKAAFFSLVKEDEINDSVALAAAAKQLRNQYHLNDINYNYMDINQYSLMKSVNEFIMNQQRLNSNSPQHAHITP